MASTKWSRTATSTWQSDLLCYSEEFGWFLVSEPALNLTARYARGTAVA
jgi:hypothetical protein